MEVARNKDRKEYGMERTDEAVSELDGTVLVEGKGVVIFPEGTTQSGRRDKKTGIRSGIVEIRNKQLATLTKNSLEKAGREVAFLPVAVDGGYNIFDTTTNKIQMEAWKCIALNEIPFVERTLATAVVGKPFTSRVFEDAGISLKDSDGINSYAMKKITALLPENMRGYYK